MNKQKIAIIGGGGCGVVTAWALGEMYDITLFEAENYLGGHAYSHTIQLKEGEAHIDMGVEYFNKKISPNLCQILKLLNIDTFISPLSFRAIFENDNSYWSNKHFKENIEEELYAELERFHYDMEEVIESKDVMYNHLTIEDFLKHKKYSKRFMHEVLYPITTVYKGCKSTVNDFSLMYFALSFDSNFLSFFSSGHWLKVKGGISRYINTLVERIKGEIRLNAKVKKVIPKPDKVKIVLEKEELIFDQVIFATHLDITLKLLGDNQAIYKRFLGRFGYTSVESCFHSDDTIVKRKNDDEYFEFRMPEKFDNQNTNQTGSLTRIYNNLFYFKKFTNPLLVTFDPYFQIDASKVFDEKKWKLPILHPKDTHRRQLIRHIQGENNCWFCGTDTSFTGHEGAIVSGLVIAEQLGVEHKFKNNPSAHHHFNTIKSFMGF